MSKLLLTPRDGEPLSYAHIQYRFLLLLIKPIWLLLAMITTTSTTSTSTYDYHFIIKELVRAFKGNFDCLGENTEKYITFSVPLKKKIENKNLEITYKIKFIDSFRFMSSSLSKLVDLNYVRITKNKKLLLKCFNCNIYYKKNLIMI